MRTRPEAVTTLRREAKTLHALRSANLPFDVPELICLANDESGESVGLIESAVGGIQLSLLVNGREPEEPLKIIAQVATEVHKLAKSAFTHLAKHADSQSHVLASLNALPGFLFGEFAEATIARDWILSQLPKYRPSTVLHGDLFPHNVLYESGENHEAAVVDWECAQIGDCIFTTLSTLVLCPIVDRSYSALYLFRMSLRDDQDWGMKIYEERARAVDNDQEVTYFFLKDYQEICRYMRTIGYGSKGRADSIEKQVAQELRPGRYCSLRTTVRGKQSTQDIALYIYHDLAGELSGSGLVVVSFDNGGEVAKQFADAWFEKGDAFMKVY